MSKLGKRSLMDNDQLLEGGGAGAGGRSSGRASSAGVNKLSREDVKGLALALGPVGAVGPLSLGAGALRERMAENRKQEQSAREAEAEIKRESRGTAEGMKKGGKVSASSRADGCCVKGKTKGRMV